MDADIQTSRIQDPYLEYRRTFQENREVERPPDILRSIIQEQDSR
jgi:hypothetical protein